MLSAYGIGLRGRVVADGATWSDHASYWRAGFGAVCVIEDRRLRSNPVWHTRNDRAGRLSWGYYLSVTKALLATTAHLARIEARTATAVRSPGWD